MNDDERLRRWRLILGGQQSDGTGCSLRGTDVSMDRALEALYDCDRRAGLGSSTPQVARWLGDIRTFFPSSVVRVMQKDALDRLNLRQMLLQPELMEAVQPDVHMVANLLSLRHLLPDQARETARQVVRQVVDELHRKLAQPLHRAVTGSLNRSVRNRRPRHNEIDWHRTIRANLRHYQPEYRTIVPETRIGYGRKRSALRQVVLCVDQSGSMATSVVYSGIFGAVMASIRALQTQIVVFDTAVVDLTHLAHDPVDLLFGTQLGGGTDIGAALRYCQELIRQPRDTIFVLISDLFDGAPHGATVKIASQLVQAGVQMVALLALNDEGAPCYDHEHAGALAALGVPSFACTPDLFPDLMAAAIQRRDLSQWAAGAGIVAARAGARA